jgi:hypothetical protein
LAVRTSDTTGASYVKAAILVPTTAETVTIAPFLRIPKAAFADVSHNTVVTDVQEEVEQSPRRVDDAAKPMVGVQSAS